MGVWVIVEAFRSVEAQRIPTVALERGRIWKLREELRQETWSAFEFDEGCPFMKNWGRGQVGKGLAITSGSQIGGVALGTNYSTSLCSHLLNCQDRVLRVILSLPGDCGQGVGTQKQEQHFSLDLNPSATEKHCWEWPDGKTLEQRETAR